MGRPARIRVTNCWLKMRNFSRLSFLRPLKKLVPADAGARLDGIDQEALLGVAVAEFLFGAGGGHLLVDLAAAVGVLEDIFGHDYCPSPPSVRP